MYAEAFGVALTNATTNQLRGHEFSRPPFYPESAIPQLCRARLCACPAGGKVLFPKVRYRIADKKTMRRLLLSHLLAAVFFMSSCGTSQKLLYADDRLSDSIALLRPENARPERGRIVPPVPEQILGKGKIDSASLVRFLLATNPFVERAFAEDFARIYIEEAAAEGVNHDVAFSQMCLETGYLSFGGLVTAEMNNYAGIGSLGPQAAGEKFPSPRIGVRAQIQHLKAYATDAPLKQTNVDPRRHFVRAGSAPTIQQLAGSWAEDKEYGLKIKTILERLYAASF